MFQRKQTQLLALAVLVLLAATLACGGSVSPPLVGQETTEPSGQEKTAIPPEAGATARYTETMMHEDEIPTLLYSTMASSYALTDNVIYVASSDNQIKAIDFVTGDVIWSEDVGGAILCADNENVYVSPSPQRVEAIDAFTGMQKWRVLLPYPLTIHALIRVGPYCIMHGNNILVWSEKPNYFPASHVIWIDKHTGNLLTIQPLWGTAKFSGDVLILGEAEVTAWSTEGEKIWELSNEEVDHGIPKLCGGLMLYWKQEDVLEAIDVTNGTIAFSANLPNSGSNIQCPSFGGEDLLNRMNTFINDPHVDAESQNIYVTASSVFYGYVDVEYLIAINRLTGEIRWLGNYSQSIFIPYSNEYQWLGEVDNKVIYSHAGFGFTQAYNAVRHELLWENDKNILAGIIGILDDTLVAISQDLELMGLDIDTGEEEWKFSLEDTDVEIGIVYNQLILGHDSSLQFVDPKAGNVVAQLMVPSSYGFSKFYPHNGFIVAGSSPAISIIKP